MRQEKPSQTKGELVKTHGTMPLDGRPRYPGMMMGNTGLVTWEATDLFRAHLSNGIGGPWKESATGERGRMWKVAWQLVRD